MPTDPPLPAVLPDGESAVRLSLAGTSCSSALFCVAVGYAADADSNYFPLAETFSDGDWTPAVLPMPVNPGATDYQGSLSSVSCPTDDHCAAAGNYGDDPPNSTRQLWERSPGSPLR